MMMLMIGVQKSVTAGTQKLLVWVNVSPFPGAIFRFQPLVFWGVRYLAGFKQDCSHVPFYEKILNPEKFSEFQVDYAQG